MKIVSGGQTGVDQAALDAALELGIDCGGWCPLGRRNEVGVIAPKYPLTETPTHEYPQRTRWNVRDSDGTLILTIGKPDGGTALTRRLARAHKKPCKVIDFNKSTLSEPKKVASWLHKKGIQILNVAGPRESSKPGIHQMAFDYLKQVILAWRANNE